MIISRRATLAAIVTAAVVAVTGGITSFAATASTTGRYTATASTTPATAPTPPRCQLGQLAARLYGPETAFPDEGFSLALANTGDQECSLYGYPGLGLEDVSHHVLASRTFWGSTVWVRDPGRHLIILSPGEAATSNVAFFASSPRRGPAVYLEVTPPNDYSYFALRIPFSLGRYILKGRLYATAMAYHTFWGGGL